jgi:hypothetical protein
MLQDLIKDANKVETIIQDWDTNINALLTAKQKHCIVTQCLFLRKIPSKSRKSRRDGLESQKGCSRYYRSMVGSTQVK